MSAENHPLVIFVNINISAVSELDAGISIILGEHIIHSDKLAVWRYDIIAYLQIAVLFPADLGENWRIVRHEFPYSWWKRYRQQFDSAVR